MCCIYNSTIDNNLEMEDLSSDDKSIDKTGYATEYFSALKREKFLCHSTTWRNSEEIMLSEISQS